MFIFVVSLLFFGKVVSYPLCQICFSGSYPSKPYTITSVMYLPGNPTCHDLYEMGKSGLIDPTLCYPLQLYMQKPCGCGPNNEQTKTTMPSSPSLSHTPSHTTAIPSTNVTETESIETSIETPPGENSTQPTVSESETITPSLSIIRPTGKKTKTTKNKK